MSTDLTESLQEQIKDAYYSSRKLNIQGSNSKKFLGHDILDEPVSVTAHAGIAHYEPTELVITARCGTPLKQIEQTLSEHKQMLAFEPPHFGNQATLGGTIACGLSGPGRVKYGAARDFVLGTRLINGQGDVLHFGGEVMKNVAGYDVSRLQTGAMGTLGLLLEISLKVLPTEDYTHTLVQNLSRDQAFEEMNKYAELPVSATAYVDGNLHLRLSGTENAIKKVTRNIGGDLLENDAQFWLNIREHQHPFFKNLVNLWRISVPPATPPVDLPGQWLIEWNGAQRWLSTDISGQHIRDIIEPLGGHATHYRSDTVKHTIFHPIPEPLMKLHRKIKHAMDPNNILNPGRMYPDL